MMLKFILKHIVFIKTKTLRYKNNAYSPFDHVIILHYISLFGLIKISDYFYSYSACQQALDDALENISEN